MNERDDLQPILESWLLDGPRVLPDPALEAALAQVHLTRQRRRRWNMAWSPLARSAFGGLAAASVVAVAIGVVGLVAWRSGSIPIGGAQVGTAPDPTVPALTDTFVSRVNGYSIDHPGSWWITAATEPNPVVDRWSAPDDPWVDVLADGGVMAVYGESRPLPAGTSADEWIATTLAKRWQAGVAGCRASTETLEINGRPWVLDVSCPALALWATAIAGERVYDFYIQGSPPDRDLLIRLLHTVRLHPEDAVVASPSPPRS